MGIFALLREYKVANAGEVRRSGNKCNYASVIALQAR